jgi:hypothetical protein
MHAVLEGEIQEDSASAVSRDEEIDCEMNHAKKKTKSLAQKELIISANEDVTS